MRRRLAMICVLVALVATARGDANVSQQQPVNADAKILADFATRIKAYMDLRNKLDDGPAKQKATENPAEIAAAQDALAARVRAARVEAKQGDIFTPEIEKKFRQLLRPEVKGPDAKKTRDAVQDEKPVVALEVNAKYPEKEPLTTMPPNVLESLPSLPKGLEYRFVRKHLILRDAQANLIIDYMLNVLP